MTLAPNEAPPCADGCVRLHPRCAGSAPPERHPKPEPDEKKHLALPPGAWVIYQFW